MHRNHALCAKLEKGAHGFFRIHVHFASAGRIVGANGEQRDIDLVALANFAESIEVSGVAAMKDGATADLHHEAAEAAVRIVQDARTPVMTRGEGDANRPMLVAFPIVQFVHAAKPEIVNEITDFERNNDRLVGGDFTQGLAIEMIEMGVSDEDQINRRKIVQTQPGMADSLDDLEPLRPVRVDEQAVSSGLHEERRVPDPGDPDFTILQLRKSGSGVFARAFGEQGRDEHLGEKISFVPGALRLQANLRRGFARRHRHAAAPLDQIGLFDRRFRLAAFTKRIGHGKEI